MQRPYKACIVAGLVCGAVLLSGCAWGAYRLVPSQYPTIQAAIDAAVNGDTVAVAPGTYNLTAPIRVTKSLTIIGDVTQPGNVVIDAGGIPGEDRDCFQVWANYVTIRGFKMIGATESGNYYTIPGFGANMEDNAGIMVCKRAYRTGANYDNTINPIHHLEFSDNEICNCGHGIYVLAGQHVLIARNKIHNTVLPSPNPNAKWAGKGIFIASDYTDTSPSGDLSKMTKDVRIVDNDIYENAIAGIELWHDYVRPTRYTPIDVGIVIENNRIWNNGGPVPGGTQLIRIGIYNHGGETNVTIRGNEIFGHDTGTGAAGFFSSSCGLYAKVAWDWNVVANDIHDNLTGIRIRNDGANVCSGLQFRWNAVRRNAVGIQIPSGSVGWARYNAFEANGRTAWIADGVLPMGVQNLGSGTFDAAANWWGRDDGPGTVGPGSGDCVSANVDYSAWLSAWSNPITFGFTGTVKDILGTAPGVNVNDPVAGYYCYNQSAVSDWYPDPNFALYCYETLPYVMSVKVGTGLTLASDPASLDARLEIWNDGVYEPYTDPTDIYSFQSRGNTSSGTLPAPDFMEIRLVDYDPSDALSSVDIPLPEWFSLSDFKPYDVEPGSFFQLLYEPGTDDYNVFAEVTGLGVANRLVLVPTSDSLYVKPGETVTVELKQDSLAAPAWGYQAFLAYDPTMLTSPSAVLTTAPYPLAVYNVIGTDTIDLAAGTVFGLGTTADALLATLTFTAGASNGTTQVAFRNNDPRSMFTDSGGFEIPATLVDSVNIVIDGTNPSVTVTSPNGGEFLKGGGSWEITWTASDANLDPNSIKIEYWDGDSWELIASGETNDGSHTWNPVPSLNINSALVRVTASDLAGNEGSDVSDAAFTIDSTQPTVDNITLTVNADGSGEDLTPSGTAIQGVYYVSACVSDNLAGIDWTALPTITVVDAEYNSLVTGPVIADQANNRFYVQITVTAASANGTASISVSGVADRSGNVAAPAYDTFNINKSQAVVTVDLEGVTAASVDRWIKFVIGGTGGTVPPVTIIKKLTFVNGRATATFTNLPNDGAWTKISAKDEQHTLRQTVDLVDTGNKQFTASFTGEDQLIGGDLTNDNLVDIRDFGLLAGQYGTSPDLNTQWPVRNANIACDGLVDSNDYTYIQIHFLARGDAEVGNALVASADLPKTSITVYELALLIGMRDALKADLNGDKVVNATDVGLFLRKYLLVK